MYFRSSLAFAIVCIGTSWTIAEQTPAGDAKKVTYENDVKPILRAHCLSCHHQGDQRGGLAMDTYTALVEGGGSGEIVYDDGDVDASRLWQLVNHDDTPVMPPNKDKLPESELAVIRAWIEGGILENNGSKAKNLKTNALASIQTTIGKPEGGGVMPAATVPQRVPVATDRAGAITAIAAAPWAPLVAIAGQRQIAMYHTDTNELLGVLPFAEGVPQSLRFNTDGSYLVAGGGEHSVGGIAAIYDVKTGQRVATVGDELDVVLDASVNATVNRVAMGGPQKMLRIYDATTGEKLFDIKKHTDWIYAVAFSPDGVLVASADRSGGLHVWESETGRPFLDLPGHKAAIRSLAWRDDSNVLVSASEDGSVKLWDMVGGKSIKSFNPGGKVTSVAMDHSGRIVTASDDNYARLFQADGGKIRDLAAMPDDVLEVAFSHDGKRAIYGDWTGKVLSVSTEDPKAVQELRANPATIADRLPASEQTLASATAKLAPLEQQLTKVAGELSAAKDEHQQHLAKIKAAEADIGKHQNQHTEWGKQMAATQAAIRDLAQSTRDHSDKMIAARLGHPNGVAEASVIAAEKALADNLQTLIAKRQSIDGLQKQIVAAAQALDQAKKQLAGLQSSTEAIVKKVQAIEANVASATAARNAAKSELQRVREKHQHLLSEKDLAAK